MGRPPDQIAREQQRLKQIQKCEQKTKEKKNLKETIRAIKECKGKQQDN